MGEPKTHRRGRRRKGPDEKKITVTTMVDPAVYRQIVSLAEAQNCSLSAVLTEGVNFVIHGGIAGGEESPTHRGIVFGQIIAATVPESDAEVFFTAIKSAPEKILTLVKKLPEDKRDLIDEIADGSFSRPLTLAEAGQMELTYIKLTRQK